MRLESTAGVGEHHKAERPGRRTVAGRPDDLLRELQILGSSSDEIQALPRLVPEVLARRGEP